MNLLRRLLLGLWSGWLVVQGAVFAPVAFATLHDTATAGRVAGAGFTLVGYASLLFGAFVFGLRTRTVGGRAREFLLALGPGLLLVASHLMLRPLISAHGAYFALAHGLGSLFYVAATVWVLALWVRDERRAGR